MLTAGVDALAGTEGNDTFLGDSASLSAADTLDGKAGTDKANLFITGNESVNASGVEQFFVQTSAAATFNMNNVTGATQLWNNDSSANLAFSNVKELATVGIKGVSGNTTTTATFNDSLLTGTSDIVNIALDGATKAGAISAGGTGGAGVETYAVSSTGTNTLAGLVTSTDTKSVTFAGAGNLTVSNKVQNATTLDGSAATGKLNLISDVAKVKVTGGSADDTITLSHVAAANALSKEVAVALGAGNDTLKITGLTAANNIEAGASFKGGAGTDSLNVTAGAVIDATTGKQFSEFETLELGGGSGTYDLAHLASTNTIGSVAVNAALGGNTVVSNVPEAASVDFGASTGANTLIVNQKDAGAGSPDDVIAVNASAKAGVTVASVDLNDIETVNVSSMSTGTNQTHTFSVLAADEATKVTVDASTAGLTITDLEADSMVLFDASASAMAVSVTTGAEAFSATSGVAFNMGQGADTVNLTGATTAGAGLEFVVTGNGGADAITLSAGGQVEHVVYKAQSDSTSADFDTVTTFTVNEDKIDIKAIGFTGQADDAVLNKANAGFSVDANGDVQVTSAVAGNFFNDAGIDRGVAILDDTNNTYVFVDADKNGDFNSDGDMVIKVAGSGLGLDAADFIFS